MEEFKLVDSDHIRLCDLMNVLQWCSSGGVAKNVIATGVVKVDGVVELRKRAKIISGQVVEYNRHQVKVK